MHHIYLFAYFQVCNQIFIKPSIYNKSLTIIPHLVI